MDDRIVGTPFQASFRTTQPGLDRKLERMSRLVVPHPVLRLNRGALEVPIPFPKGTAIPVAATLVRLLISALVRRTT